MSEQLTKLRPALISLAVLIVGAILGALFGWSTVSIQNTGPWQLDLSYQGIYVQAVADSYAADNFDALAADRLSYLCQQNNGLTAAFDEAARRYGDDPVRSANLDQLKTLVDSGAVVQNDPIGVCSTTPITGLAKLGKILAPVLLVLIAAAIVALNILMPGTAAESAAPAAPAHARLSSAPAAAPSTKTPASTTGPPSAAAPSAAAPPPSEQVTRPRAALPFLGRKKEEEETVPRSAAQAGAMISKEAEKTDFEAIGKEPPIVQFMTTYLHGDDLYDDSFSIETSAGEFLGETGVGISDSLGSSGEAKNVTAIEVWLFDKNDIRTVTKVMMSDHAFNDDAVRAKLAPKGEAVKAEAGDKVILETATLRVQARIVDLAYKSDTMPPNGVFDRITLELAAWKREGGDAPRPAATGLPGTGGSTPPGLPPLPGSGG